MPALVPTSEDHRIYEIVVLLPYPLLQKDEQKVLNDVESLLAEAGGVQVSRDVWGRRGLAYPIEGNTEGVYVVYHYEMAPGKISEVHEALSIMPNVLRHIIVKPPKEYVIVKYSETYEQWLKERESAEETRKREREAELQRKVAERAKRQAKKSGDRAKKVEAETPATPLEKRQITEEIDKLISDEDIAL